MCYLHHYAPFWDLRQFIVVTFKQNMQFKIKRGYFITKSAKKNSNPLGALAVQRFFRKIILTDLVYTGSANYDTLGTNIYDWLNALSI